jgi:hypothetical protein
MKFKENTLIWSYINLWYLNMCWLVKNNIVNFSLIGSKVFYSLNIQRKMLHFISLVIYFQVSHLESQDQTHSLLKDLIIGRKLMMENDVIFWLIWEKNLNSQLINLLSDAWKLWKNSHVILRMKLKCKFLKKF